MANTSILIARLREAESTLPPRRRYAKDVLVGRQSWSGADLRGKASRYGAGYYRQRLHAKDALISAGGDLAYVGRHGKLCAVVAVGVDDFGNELFQTLLGPAVANAKRNLQRLA